MKNTKRWQVQSDQLLQTGQQHLKTAESLTNNHDAITEAAAMLQSGKTIAFPTETVYGLGADATSSTAVNGIFAAKGRPADNPLIAHVATKAQLMRLVDNLPPLAEQLIDAFTPGPITFVLPSNGTCASNVTANLETIGIRIPEHPVARALLTTCDIPLAAPSANTSGRPSPTKADHVWDDLNGKIDGLIDGGTTGVGVESTVVDCTGDVPLILRPGAVTPQQIADVAGDVRMTSAQSAQASQPSAPGMKYRHYAPDVPLLLVDVDKLQQTVSSEQAAGKRVGLLASDDVARFLDADQVYQLGSTLSDAAAHLYDGLRLFKKGEVDLIICQTFPEEGIGSALMNRLKKAADN